MYISISAAFDDAVKTVHNAGGYNPEMLANGSGAELIRQISNALTKPLDNLELRQQVPPTLSAALRDNIFIFSGFKTANELQEVSAMLRDDSGNTKPFNTFLQDVRAIDETYNKNYLYAEYNYATASCQMATKWKEWEADGDDYDLQYRTANDANVREEHRALHNTTLPMSDPFWNSYLPPNGWNCRCTAVQVRKGKYEVSNSAEAIAKGEAATALPKQKIFRFNPGKQMKVFPDKHPYFPKGCGNCNKSLLSYNPNNVDCQNCKAIAKCLKNFGDKEKATARVKVLKKEASHFIGEEIQHPTFNIKATITGASLKEILNQPHSHFYEKNEAILNIDKIYQESKYLGELDKKPNVRFDSYLFETSIAGDKSWIIVKKFEFNRQAIIYSISDSDKLLDYIKKKVP